MDTKNGLVSNVAACGRMLKKMESDISMTVPCSNAYVGLAESILEFRYVTVGDED